MYNKYSRKTIIETCSTQLNTVEVWEFAKRSWAKIVAINSTQEYRNEIKNTTNIYIS